MKQSWMSLTIGLAMMMTGACFQFDVGGILMVDASIDASSDAALSPNECEGTDTDGMPCGDMNTVPCQPWTCKDQACTMTYAPAGTLCDADGSRGQCDEPDTCDAYGQCIINTADDGAMCSDCAAGEGWCAGCWSGVCEDIDCSADTCNNVLDCRNDNISNTCVPSDSVEIQCVGVIPASSMTAGAPAGTAFNTWQPGGAAIEMPPFAEKGRFSYCNLTTPVPEAGVLTSWTLGVHQTTTKDSVAQLIVIRCSGSSKSGDTQTDCIRVGKGPENMLDNYMPGSFFSLQGFVQEDGVEPNELGIVVQSGDLLCVEGEKFQLGVDCNGSAMTDGCDSAPPHDILALVDLSTTSQPFSIFDPSDTGVDPNGVLMVMATGTADPVPGQCTPTMR